MVGSSSSVFRSCSICLRYSSRKLVVKMKLKVLTLFLIPFFLGGCWDAEEITDRTVVLASGMDMTANGLVKVSAQVPIVEELLPITGNSSDAKHFSVLTAEGASPFAAMAGLQSKTQ